ncbi:MAG: T9SS type A sorting domain-containing protein [Ignavibacteriales bacterium]|nr:T9SS type A sorting domain-containing protein [Ignavibacteriales bacterium]
MEATDESSLVIGKYATGWELPTIGTRTPGNTDDGGSIQAIGLTAFSDFTIGKENQALPVELTAFNSQYNNNKITLVWTTATEVNNSGFYVERSITTHPNLSVAPKPLWETLGFVNGSGNSNTNRTYKFLDNNLHGNGRYAYRLKQVDNDGKFQYAGKTAVEVKIIPKEYGLLQNYPNPFNPSTTISYMLPRRSSVKLELYASTGQLIVVLFDGPQDAGYQTYKLNTEKLSLSSGIYIYKLTAVDEQYQVHSVGVRKLTLIK